MTAAELLAAADGIDHWPALHDWARDFAAATGLFMPDETRLGVWLSLPPRARWQEYGDYDVIVHRTKGGFVPHRWCRLTPMGEGGPVPESCRWLLRRLEESRP